MVLLRPDARGRLLPDPFPLASLDTKRLSSLNPLRHDLISLRLGEGSSTPSTIVRNPSEVFIGSVWGFQKLVVCRKETTTNIVERGISLLVTCVEGNVLSPSHRTTGSPLWDEKTPRTLSPIPIHGNGSFPSVIDHKTR